MKRKNRNSLDFKIKVFLSRKTSLHRLHYKISTLSVNTAIHFHPLKTINNFNDSLQLLGSNNTNKISMNCSELSHNSNFIFQKHKKELKNMVH